MVQRQFRQNFVMYIWHTANRPLRGIVSRKPGTRYSDVLGEILSRKSGTWHTDVLGQLRHVRLAHGAETFQRKCCHINLALGKQMFLVNSIS